MKVYYNEIDKYCVRWLKNLMSKRLIPSGDIDDRSIEEVTHADINGYDQCHFFAGLGGWPFALKLARWPNPRPVWTGSCPCQPFSLVGKREGHADKRHLWPAWFRLISKLEPPTVFGEQVASAITAGWYDQVADDLENKGYAIGSAILPACSIGAPHRRDRLFFVAHSNSLRKSQQEGFEQDVRRRSSNSSETVANATRRESGRLQQSRVQSNPRASSKTFPYASSLGLQAQGMRQRCAPSQPQPPHCNWWESEPSVGRMVNGVSARMGKLRALGNAIVPQIAAEFIKASNVGLNYE
jgi:DNA (cytosine-5)-methyltransferase 1